MGWRRQIEDVKGTSYHTRCGRRRGCRLHRIRSHNRQVLDQDHLPAQCNIHDDFVWFTIALRSALRIFIPVGVLNDNYVGRARRGNGLPRYMHAWLPIWVQNDSVQHLQIQSVSLCLLCLLHQLATGNVDCLSCLLLHMLRVHHSCMDNILQVFRNQVGGRNRGDARKRSRIWGKSNNCSLAATFSHD